VDDQVARLTRWSTLRCQIPVNVKRLPIYDRLMDAEAALDGVRMRMGVSDTALGDALERTESEGEEDVYLTTLVDYVAELGGQVEVRAVFPGETVTLLTEPAG
jgi:hypothetical protein